MNPEYFKYKLSLNNIFLSNEQIQQFNLYYKLLIDANNYINLTSITNKNDVYLKHFYDSILPSIIFSPLQHANNICDVGAGAGFPSIPMKILFPDIKLTVIDSLNKRVNFLKYLIKNLNLKDTYIYHTRAEDFGHKNDTRESYDYVIARAVAKLNVLSELCLPLVKRDGFFLALKSKTVKDELISAYNAINILGGKVFKNYEYSLPFNVGTRDLVVIKKLKLTPKKYPRKAGIPNKKPIL